MSSTAPDVPPDQLEITRATLEQIGVSENVRLAERLVSEALGLITDDPTTLDLKIAAAALAEMRDAFSVFAPYKQIRKVSIFGSARTEPDDPLYMQAHDLAEALAARGWMAVTGAGPGIMEAGMKGAGRENSLGVSIRLPFESGANSIIADDDKHVSMKYFFTRKLMLIKESQAFVSLPGGVGTLDETFELLTLTQTGKGLPVPIVLLDAPGDPYWEEVDRFVREQLMRRGLVSPGDVGMYTITQSVDEACAVIENFYRVYHSIRFVGDRLVIRLLQPPTDAQLAALNDDFAHVVRRGQITRTEALRAERRDGDHADLPRLLLDFNRHGFAELIEMIRAINSWAPA